VSEPTTAAGRGHVIIPCDLNADEFAAITRAIRERCEDAAAEARADERARLADVQRYTLTFEPDDSVYMVLDPDGEYVMWQDIEP